MNGFSVLPSTLLSTSRIWSGQADELHAASQRLGTAKDAAGSVGPRATAAVTTFLQTWSQNARTVAYQSQARANALQAVAHAYVAYDQQAADDMRSLLTWGDARREPVGPIPRRSAPLPAMELGDEGPRPAYGHGVPE